MQICALSASLAERYELFVLSHPETMLYQSWRYQSLIIELLGCSQLGLVALDEDGCILGALPLLGIEGPLGLVLNSLPFYGSNGGLIGHDKVALAGLREAYSNLVHLQGVAASTVVENPLATGSVDGLVYGLIDERIGQFTSLPQQGETKKNLMQSFHYKTRNMIRKAEKNGVCVEVDNSAMSFICQTHEDNMIEIGGMAKPRRFFDLIPIYFEAERDYRIYVAKIGGELVAAVLVFFYNRVVEYYTPVIKKEYRDTQALSAVIFRAMCDAADSEFAWWNWGGTWLSQDGVYRFKSRWGTKDMRYKYLIQVANTAVLDTPRTELATSYPYFYTVPFSVLNG